MDGLDILDNRSKTVRSRTINFIFDTNSGEPQGPFYRHKQ